MLEELEKHMDSNAKQVLKNMEFVDKLREASSITGRISEAEAMTVSSKTDDQTLINEKKRLSEIKQELNDLTSSYIGHKYTKEGFENQYHRPMAGTNATIRESQS